MIECMMITVDFLVKTRLIKNVVPEDRLSALRYILFLNQVRFLMVVSSFEVY